MDADWRLPRAPARLRRGPGAPWLGTHGRQRTARLALRGGGVTAYCRSGQDILFQK